MLVLLYGLVRYHRPDFVAEAGTYKGHAACVMATAMKDGAIDGHIFTADIRDFGAKALVETNGHGDRVTVFDGDFSDMLATTDCAFGLAFIDSGFVPSLPDAPAITVDKNIRIRHYRAVRERMAPHGLIVVDDMNGPFEGREEILREAHIIGSRGGRGVAIVAL